MTTELKPCPFPGGESDEVQSEWLGLRHHTINFELGNKKNSKRHIFLQVTGSAKTFEEAKRIAYELWNTRHYPADVQQAIDKQKPELAIITKELGYHPDGDVYEVGCPDCGKVLRYVNFVRGATTDCIRHCMDCGKKMNVRIDAEVEDE